MPTLSLVGQVKSCIGMGNFARAQARIHDLRLLEVDPEIVDVLQEELDRAKN